MRTLWEPRIVGRRREQAILHEVLTSPDAELVAIYGRRRVGKTHLIREFFLPRADLYFTVTGERDAPTATQLHHFRRELERTFYGGAPLPALTSWEQALDLLCDAIENRVRASTIGTIVIFLDELPWLSSRKSRLLPALDHAWNRRLSLIPAVRLVVCGSAASWILEKLIHAKGGLHNRITRRLRLEPFTLQEAGEFLASRGFKLGPTQVVELFMALGGIPHYLKLLQRRLSPAQNIASICFDRGGELVDEFPRLFSALFTSSEAHEKIVRALARRACGVMRKELLADTRLPSGGTLARRLRELEEAGFIASLRPYGHRTKLATYRLIDEYAWFYLTWIERAPKGVLASADTSYWLSKIRTPAFQAWSGYAFESVCFKHAQQIKRVLGIEQIPSDVSTWRHVPGPRSRSRTRQGAQIDLIFDRDDGVITLCEMKYAGDRFQISKDHARDLEEKMEIFRRHTGTRKQLQWTIVTTHGVQHGRWSDDLIDHVVTVEEIVHA